jgi:hypothetical protein
MGFGKGRDGFDGLLTCQGSMEGSYTLTLDTLTLIPLRVYKPLLFTRFLLSVTHG